MVLLNRHERQARGEPCGRDDCLEDGLFRHREVVYMYQELSEVGGGFLLVRKQVKIRDQRSEIFF